MVIDGKGNDVGSLASVLGIKGQSPADMNPDLVERLQLLHSTSCRDCGFPLLIATASAQSMFLASRLCTACSEPKPRRKQADPRFSQLELLARLLEGRR